MMSEIGRAEAAKRLRELADEIYYVLDEMEDVLREVAPEELERAEAYWMAHIDGALLSIKGWVGGRSLISLEDTLAALEEEDEEFEDEEPEKSAKSHKKFFR
jgi:uncharacterized protein CbrC (UPF0167 family)